MYRSGLEGLCLLLLQLLFLGWRNGDEKVRVCCVLCRPGNKLKDGSKNLLVGGDSLSQPYELNCRLPQQAHECAPPSAHVRYWTSPNAFCLQMQWGKKLWVLTKFESVTRLLQFKLGKFSQFHFLFLNQARARVLCFFFFSGLFVM
jgi:hypothetical protein